MSFRKSMKANPAASRAPRLKFADGQTRRIMIDLSKTPKTAFWCRTRRNTKCVIGGCGMCATELNGQASHTAIASVYDPVTAAWIDMQWNMSTTTLHTVGSVGDEDTRMVELDVTRKGTGFDTEYTVKVIAIDEVEDAPDPDEMDAPETDENGPEIYPVDTRR